MMIVNDETWKEVANTQHVAPYFCPLADERERYRPTLSEHGVA